MKTCRTALALLSLLLVAQGAPADAPRIKEIVIVVDPGHGGVDPPKVEMKKLEEQRLYSSPNNAKNPDGSIKEKHITLELATKIKNEIDRQGASENPPIRAVLTRTADTNPNMGERAQTAATHGAASFVSIHFNASETKTAHGPKAYIPGISQNEPAKPRRPADAEYAMGLVEAVAKSLPASIRPEISGLKLGDEVQTEFEVPIKKDEKTGVIHGSNLFYQLNRRRETASIPTCFLEVEFMDNPKVDGALLKDGKWKTTFDPIARSIAEQLIRWHKKNP